MPSASVSFPIIVLFVALGLVIGFLFYILAKRQIKVRIEKIPSLADDYIPQLLNKKWVLPVWEIAFAGLYTASYFLFSDNIASLIYSIIFISCSINIVFIDLAIRRIPNELLLTMLIVSLVKFIAEPLIYEGSIKQNLILAVVGIVCGFVLFSLPQKLGRYIGAGDIKLSAVIGFSLGVVGYLQAMIIMALIMLVYLVILLVTKKGNMKSFAPMGPALCVGSIISLLFPILSNNITIL